MRTIQSGIIFALFLLLLGRAPSLAQTGDLAVRGGLSLATIAVDVERQDGEDVGRSRLGFALGADYTAPLGGQLSVRPGLFFVQKGEKDENDDDVVKLDYLQVPILFQLALGSEDSGLRPRVFAGPALAFNVTCEGEDESGEVAECHDDEINSFEAALSVGAGITVADQFQVEARYDWGLTDVYSDEIDPAGVLSFTNRAFIVSVGISL